MRIIPSLRANTKGLLSSRKNKSGSFCMLAYFVAIFFAMIKSSVALKSISSSIGVSFTGAGLLTPFHIGVSQYLQENKIINDKNILAGSSGGALAAATTALKVNAGQALDSTVYIASECRDKGTRLTLRLALEEVLNTVLPSDAAERLRKRSAACYIAYAQLSPAITSCLVNEFKDKEDLISVLLASCNIPFYFNGNALTVDVRRGSGVDGYFSMNLNRFGAPSTGCLQEVIVCPLPPRLVFLDPVPQQIVLPDNSLQTQQIDIISPSLLSNQDWILSTFENVQMALQPPSESLVQTIDNKLSRAGTASVDNLRSSVKCLRRYEGCTGINLAYTYLFNSGVLAARTWQLNKEGKNK